MFDYLQRVKSAFRELPSFRRLSHSNCHTLWQPQKSNQRVTLYYGGGVNLKYSSDQLDLRPLDLGEFKGITHSRLPDIKSFKQPVSAPQRPVQQQQQPEPVYQSRPVYTPEATYQEPVSSYTVSRFVILFPVAIHDLSMRIYSSQTVSRVNTPRLQWSIERLWIHKRWCSDDPFNRLAHDIIIRVSWEPSRLTLSVIQHFSI